MPQGVAEGEEALMQDEEVQMNSNQVDNVSKPRALVVMGTHLWLGLHLQCTKSDWSLQFSG